MTRRLSLVIDDRAETVVAPFLDTDSPQRRYAAGDDATDAAILRTLLVRGAQELERERLADWYAEFAADHADLDRELAEESSAAMRRVLAAEAEAERSAAGS
jgi:hypothetical protein